MLPYMLIYVFHRIFLILGHETWSTIRDRNEECYCRICVWRGGGGGGGGEGGVVTSCSCS